MAAVAAESAAIDATVSALGSAWLGANPRHQYALESAGLQGTSRSLTALDVARRPHTRLADVIEALAGLEMWDGPNLAGRELVRAGIAVQYGSFIEKERKEALRHQANESRSIPRDVDFGAIRGLRIEAAQRLADARPLTIGQAARTAGVTPSDIGALLVHITRQQGAVTSETSQNGSGSRVVAARVQGV
jgi:tRNA uridine 5-carboxymethylaminomethyl modification enzyme